MTNRQKSRFYKTKNGASKISPSFLLVCEGTATEPQYFHFLKAQHFLMGVEIDNKSGSSPSSIAECAAKKAWDYEYDYIYCIFDRDDHKDFASAIRTIEKLRQELKAAGRKTKIEIIVSYPCFELWLLYHFKYTDKKAGNGKCEPVARILRKQAKFKNFDKRFDKNQLKFLYAKIDVAIKNAEKSVQRTKSLADKNPSTNVHEVIKKLLAVAQKRGANKR